MPIFFFGYGYLDNVSFLDCREQARVSVKRGYVWREKSFISSKVMNLDYILFYWHTWRPSTITGAIKRTAFVYWLRSNQYVSNLYILDQNTRLSSLQLVWRTRNIFRFFSYVAISHLLRRREDVGICFNQLQIGFPLSSRFINGLE